MRFDNAYQHLEQAAAKTLDVIRRDEERAPSSVRPAFACIREHLFESDFNVEQLSVRSKVTSHVFATQFRQVAASMPGDYIRQRRFETAERLVRETSLPMAEIGFMIGFDRPDTFSAFFKKTLGLPASEHRRQCREHSEQRVGDDGEAIEVEVLRRAALGHATAVEVETVTGWIQGERARQGLPRLVPVAGAGEKQAASDAERDAALLWRVLADLPHERRLEVVREQVFRTTAMFEELRRRSRLAGRHDRGQAVELAEVAVVASGHQTGVVPDDAELAALQARAFAWLTISEVRNENFVEAEKAVVEKSRLRRDLPEDSLAVAESLHAEASLRLHQLQPGKALPLQRKAVAAFRQLGGLGELLRSVMQLGNIFDLQSRPEEALAAYAEAKAILLQRPDAMLELMLNVSTASALMFSGRLSEAKKKIEESVEAAQTFKMVPFMDQIIWTRGLIAHRSGQMSDAETDYRVVLASLEDSKNNHNQELGLVRLDLALLYIEMHRVPQALGHLDKAVFLLKACGGFPELIESANHLVSDLRSGLIEAVGQTFELLYAKLNADRRMISAVPSRNRAMASSA